MSTSPLTYDSPKMKEIMRTQTTMEFGSVTQAEIDRQNSFRNNRFIPILAIVLTVNNTNSKESMHATIFGDGKGGKVEDSHKILFYDMLRRAYYHNLDVVVTALTSLGLKVAWTDVNVSPKTAWRKIEGVMGLLKRGVSSTWDEYNMSKQRQAESNDTKKANRGGGLFVSEFLFLWPLIAGTFKERKSVIDVADMMSGETHAVLNSLCYELGLFDHYPVVANNGIGNPLEN